MSIHPSAIVSPNAQLEEDVTVGPYAFIGKNTHLGKGTVVHHHATIDGHTKMGEENVIYPYAFLGAASASKHSKNREKGKLTIGNKNTFREYTTIHTSDEAEGNTHIGDENWIMQYAHLGHDTQLGNHTILSSHAQLGGYAKVQNNAYINALSSLIQFGIIGTTAMVGSYTAVVEHVFPFTIYHQNRHRATNVIGMERNGYSQEEINTAKKLFKLFFGKQHHFEQAKEILNTQKDNNRIVKLYQQFINTTAGKRRP